jgi:uncharacterized protein YpiB (UPF0302 family)
LFRFRLEEVKHDQAPIIEEKRKTADRLLEQGLTQELKEALLSNLDLLLQLDQKLLELDMQYMCLIQCGQHAEQLE